MNELRFLFVCNVNCKLLLMLLSAELIFKDLPGVWCFHRRILNPRSKQLLGSVQGQATFQPQSQICRQYTFHETGLLKLPTQREVPVHREYYYKISEDKAYIEVFFDKALSRLFHTIRAPAEVSSGLWTTRDVHSCAPDLYHIKYEFTQHTNGSLPTIFSEFIIEYKVEGPNKDYISQTCFRRS